MQSGGDLIQFLQEVDLFVVADPECEQFHHGDPHPTNICAGVPEGGKGQCSVRFSAILYSAALTERGANF